MSRFKKKPDHEEDNKQKYDSELSKRVYGFWGLNSLLGMILAYFTIGLFQIAGITFSDLTFDGIRLSGRFWDVFFSGVIIGAGTKPLHDLIDYLQNQKMKS